jgi:hypothetical protein
MRKFLFILLCCSSFFYLHANEQVFSQNISFNYPEKTDFNKKTINDFEMTRRLINYNRCNTTGIFLLSYSIPSFLWSVVSTSVFSTQTTDSSAQMWGSTALTSGLLCSGLLCSGLILLIFGAVKYYKNKKWGHNETLFNVFSFRQRLFSYLAIGSGITTGISTASLVGCATTMLFLPDIVSSYIFCGITISSFVLLTLSLPLMVVCLSLRSWLKKECRRIGFNISQTKEKDLRLSVSIPLYQEK